MNWPRIHPAGWPIIAVFAMVSLVAALLFEPLGWIGLAATAWCVLFFRDPDRQPPKGEGLVVSPADGVVQQMARAAPPPELGMGETALQRVSVFMNVFDCHVNRMPIAGTVERLEYRPGKFLNATFDKASELNERLSIRLRTDLGPEIAVVQIAGLVARRIVSDLEAGRHVATGARIGMIRFGSRLDVYLPDEFAVRVAKGERTVAGQTVIAEAVSGAPGRDSSQTAPEAGTEPRGAETEEVT